MRTDPYAPWKTWWAVWQMTLEAQTVIGLRSLALWGVLPARPGENRRMVEEKMRAFAASGLAAGAAAMRGGSPDAVAQAAIRPIARRTRSNVRRLTRAPKTGD